MKTSRAVLWLSAAVAALALVAAGAGLFWSGGGGSYRFTSVHGQAVEMYGRGLYRHDTLFVGSLNRGTDAATLVVAVPLLVFAVLWYRRGSLRGALLLTGVLAYFLYVYASYALGAAAYNDLFLVYAALFSASLFALARLLLAVDLRALPARLSPRLPQRGAARFMVACGVVTTAVWLGMGLLPSLIQGDPPEHLDTYATMVTDALDLGIIAPATFLVGYLLYRRAPLGYVLAFLLLGILVLLGPAFVAQPISQVSAGVSFSAGEIIGPVSGFGILSLIAIWLMVSFLRNIADEVPTQTSSSGKDDDQRSVAVTAPRSRQGSPASSIS